MEHSLELVGTIIGLFYLWFEYRASIYVWITGIVMSSICMIIYYQNGLYADFGISLGYFLISIYGWFVWKQRKRPREKEKETELKITSISTCLLPQLIASFVMVLMAIAWVLIHYTERDVVWLDSFTTSLSIIGLWMLAHKYVEQWGCWFIVAIVSSCLYVHKAHYFTAGFYALYAVISFFGYRKWKCMMDSPL